ncbi:MAG: hypothetical protein MZV49_08105 [Rhodopseudomonas palustris]|nr:hypothetical protein [Rhodopseudomonas palustris]
MTARCVAACNACSKKACGRSPARVIEVRLTTEAGRRGAFAVVRSPGPLTTGHGGASQRQARQFHRAQHPAAPCSGRAGP